MLKTPEYKIQIIWDDEAEVWIAESEDLPGLVLESNSIDALIERTRLAAADLLEVSGSDASAFLDFSMTRQMIVA
jgi:predicted RNase H-like HicB family nuclease